MINAGGHLYHSSESGADKNSSLCASLDHSNTFSSSLVFAVSELEAVRLCSTWAMQAFP